MIRLQEECDVAMYVDLHAHSRKHNVFIYGCESRRNSDKRLQEQVFPLMLHKNAADKVKNLFTLCILQMPWKIADENFVGFSFRSKTANFAYKKVKKAQDG